MDSKTLALIVKGIDEASKVLGDVQSGVQDLGSEALDASRDLQPLGRGLSAVGAAGVALISITALTAARVEVLGTVLDTVGETAGYTEGQLDTLEDGVTGLGITTGAARQGLIQMMQAELDLAEATDIASIAQDAAVIANVNSSAAYETLVRGLLTGRTVLLKSLGLTVDFNAAYQRQAKLLDKTTKELTANEKMTARLNEVKRAGAIIEGSYEAAMGDVGKKLTSMPRLTEEAGRALGEAYLPAMETAVDVTSDLLKAFIDLEPEQQATIAHFIALGTGITAPTGAAILLLPQLLAIGKSLGIVWGWSQKTAFSMHLLATNAGISAAGIFSVLAPLAAMYAAMVLLDSAYQPHIDNIIETTESYHAYAVNMSYAGREADILTEAEWELARVSGPASDGLENLTHETYRLNAGARTAGGGVDYAREMTTGWESALLNIGQPLTDTNTETWILNDASLAAAAEVGNLAISTSTFAGSLGELDFKNEDIWEMALASGASNEQMLALAVSTGKVTQTEADLTTKGYALTQMWVDGKIDLDTYTSMMADLEDQMEWATSDAGRLVDALNNLKPSYAVNVHTTYTEEGIPSWTPEGPPQYQSGTDYVPQSGLAYLHEGEAVLTKEENRGGNRDSQVIITNHFGRDSVRSEADIRQIADDQQRMLELQGMRGRIS